MTQDPPPTQDPAARRERRRRAASRRARRRGLIRLGILVLLVCAAVVLITQVEGGSGRHPASVAAAGSTKDASVPFSVPRLLDPHNVYAADRPGRLSPAVSKFPSRVYVPNSESNTVSVIDPSTYKVIDQFPVGAHPQHVVPVLRPEDALGEQRPGQQPDRDRPADREGPAAPSR